MFEMNATLLPSGDQVASAHLARHVQLLDRQTARFDLRVGLRRNLLRIGDGLRRRQGLGGGFRNNGAHMVLTIMTIAKSAQRRMARILKVR